MKKLYFLLAFIVSYVLSYGQPISVNPDGTVVIDGTGKIVKPTRKMFYFFSKQTGTISNFTIGYIVKTGGNVFIRWSGSATNKLTANGTVQTINTAFSAIRDTNRTLPIIVWGDLDSITRFTMGNATIWLDIAMLAQMMPKLTYFDFSSGYLSSSYLADFPKTLITLNLNGAKDYNNKRIWGSINDLSPTVLNMGFGTTGDSIGGNLEALPAGMQNFYCRKNGVYFETKYQLKGRYAYLPRNLLSFTIWENGGWYGGIGDSSQRNIYGNYADLPRTLITLGLENNFGSSKGSWAGLPPNLTSLFLHQDVAPYYAPSYSTTIYDTTHLNLIDLPRSITSLTILYENKLSTANRKVYGTLADLPPNLTSLSLGDLDTMITGNIAILPSTINSTISFSNNASLSGWGHNRITYTSGTPPAWAAVTITVQTCMNSTNVDNFLIAWAPVAGTGTKTITLSKARTSASDAAVTTLAGKGKTIVTSSTYCP